MRVLLTGAAGFIGTATATELQRRDIDVVAVDVLLPEAHGVATRAEPPEGVHRLDTRDALQWAALLDGIDVVVHLAAMVGAGVTASDLPLYAGHNDLGTACRSRGDARARRALPRAGVVDGRLRRRPVPLPRARRPGTGGAVPRVAGEGCVREPVPDMRWRPGLAARRRVDCPGPAQLVRGEQGGPGALRGRVGPAVTRCRDLAEVPQRLRRGDAARHPLLGRGRDVPVLARARRGAGRLRGRRPDARLRARRGRRPGQRRRGPGRGRPGRRVAHRLQRLLRSPDRDRRRRPCGGRRQRACPRARMPSWHRA